MDLNININDVSETAFLTLYCHALDAQSKKPILNDISSIKIAQLLNNELSNSNKKLHRILTKGKIYKKLIVHTSIRAKKYDKYTTDFIKKYPKASIVNIGCGLDNRFERVDNGQIDFFDLDLPDIIEIKKHFFKETNRYRFIPQSVFDFSWMKRIKGNNILFLAEGVFMYCEEMDVKSLFLTLQKGFPGSEIVCEVFNSLWLKGWLKKMMNMKMQQELNLGKESTFRFGIRHSLEMESWSKGIKFLDDWSYFDSNEKKLGWIKIFRHFSLFRNTQWTVHYKLN